MVFDDVPMLASVRRQWERLNLDDKILVQLAFTQAMKAPKLVTGYCRGVGRSGDRRYWIHHIPIGLCEFHIAETRKGFCVIKFLFTGEHERLAAE